MAILATLKTPTAVATARISHLLRLVGGSRRCGRLAPVVGPATSIPLVNARSCRGSASPDGLDLPSSLCPPPCRDGIGVSTAGASPTSAGVSDPGTI